MQTALKNMVVEAAKTTGIVAVTFAAVVVGLHLGGKIAGHVIEGGELVAATATGLVVGTREKVSGLFQKKEQTEAVKAAA